jgi:D-alanyl-D-alanine endopeptidase (penicillin-binding protein 7)
MRIRGSAAGIVAAAFLFVAVVPAHAQESVPLGDAEAAQARLRAIFRERGDLQDAFSAKDWRAVPASRAGNLKTLEDWARKYGYKEYPEELIWYSPGAKPRGETPLALRPVTGAVAPTLKQGASFNFDSLTAKSVYVVDVASHQTLVARNSRVPHPLASITKLMTAMVALDKKVSMDRVMTLSEGDEVGGARLRVATGTKVTVRGLMDAMLIGSANNAANALARSTMMSRAAFVEAMNAKAAALGLSSTVFADPSGIEVGNMSTPEDIAALGLEAFGRDSVRRATTTSKLTMSLARTTHTIKNTNDLLNDPDNGLYVMGGKTGYLEESMWNLVVKMKDSRGKPILVVVLGSDSRVQSFKDAETVARWVWENYRWAKS